MKERFELVYRGKDSYKIRYIKRHWWSKWKIELEYNTNVPKIYPVDQENCAHHLEFSHIVEYYYRPIPLRIYRCTKCGYSQVGKDHIPGKKYE